MVVEQPQAPALVIAPAASTQELHRILDCQHLSALFQPIVSLNERNILGYEALIRGPSTSPLHNPLNLFDAASRAGRLVDLELLCRSVVIRQFTALKLPGKLFINVTPNSLLEPDFQNGQTLALLKQVGLPSSRVVIELTEQYPTEDYGVMRRATEHYRTMGFEIAIDDLGAGYSGLRLWSELRPDYVKIDRHFIQNLHEDPAKQEFVRSIKEIASGLKCRAIAEGVETRDEFCTLRKLGLNFCQGYYFDRPRATPGLTLPQEKFTTDTGQQCCTPNRLSETVERLVVSVPFVTPNTKIETVADLLRNATTLHSIPVVESDIPLGIVRRTRFMNLFASPFGRDLYGRKPIIQFMDRDVHIFDKNLPIEQASQALTDTPRDAAENDFIITHEGRYVGIGLLTDLLKRITELQIRYARYANPLTLLPGNVPIYEQLERLLNEHTPFTVCYCDLDNFKPFNDVYGYSNGDHVIQQVADLLKTHAEPNQDFVGHIGGDDFIVVFQSEDWQTRCQRILADFEQGIPALYSQEDVAQGGIVAKDRLGNEVFYPILSLSIGAVIPDPQRCRSYHDVAQLASDAKRQAKKMNGNALFIDQRRGPSTPE